MDKGVRRVGRAVAGLAVGAALLVGSFALANRESVRDEPRLPGVVLRRGTFEGVPWVFGTSEFHDGRPCAELVMNGKGPACGSFPPRIRAIEFYTSSGGNSGGIKTAEGFASPDVVSVVALAGGKSVGEAHVIDLPQPVAGKKRAVVAFVTEADLDGRAWVAVAFDERSRVVGRDVISSG